VCASSFRSQPFSFVEQPSSSLREPSIIQREAAWLKICSLMYLSRVGQEGYATHSPIESGVLSLMEGSDKAERLRGSYITSR
jgi:hypothetical protein